jgi:hypothetical protein
VLGKDGDRDAAALMRGTFPRCVVQRIDELFLNGLLQDSATAGRRSPLYLGAHEARTHMFL